MAWSAFELEGLHDAIRRWRAVENTVKPVLDAIAVPMDEAPRTSVTGVETVNDHCQITWAEPLHEQLRVGVGAKEEITWRGKLPRDQDLMTPWLGDDLCLTHDGFLSLNRRLPGLGLDGVNRRRHSSAPRAARRAGRSVRPRTPGTWPATRSPPATAPLR